MARGGKASGGHPRSPALAVAWGLACAVSCPQAAHKRPLHFSSLSHSRPGPTPAQALQTAGARQKPCSEADKHPGRHRVRDSRAPFLKAPQCRLSPRLCPQRKLFQLSASQPLSLRPSFTWSLRCRLGETGNLPNHLNLFVGQRCHPEIFGTAANGTLVNAMEREDLKAVAHQDLLLFAVLRPP